jgi:UDP-glucose 4-epimerase
MKVLVTGAAGYIGSAVCWKLLEHGHEVVALDNLKYGTADSVPPGVPLIRRDLASPQDQLAIVYALESNQIEAVAHLAAESLIPLSFEQPELFWRVNVTGGLMLLDAMRRAGVRRILYSSTSSVYAEHQPMPLTEQSPIGPSSCYGASKYAFEDALRWMRNLSWVAFRYFNVCGATEHVTEKPYHRSRLVPVALDVAYGRVPGPMPLNGIDYQETRDHTCLRDYIHVDDIAQAHVAALEHPGATGVFNLGIGRGYTNREVIEAVRRVAGKPVPVVEKPRRPGDPAMLVADASKAGRELDWGPAYTTIEQMIETCCKYEQL